MHFMTLFICDNLNYIILSDFRCLQFHFHVTHIVLAIDFKVPLNSVLFLLGNSWKIHAYKFLFTNQYTMNCQRKLKKSSKII